MMKRVFIILLLFVLLPMLPVTAENTGSEYEKNIKILYSLGILDSVYVQLNDETSVISEGTVNAIINRFNGYLSGSIESYADITVGIAAGKMIYAMGYNYMLERKASNEEAYYSVAQSRNLLKGITAPPTALLESGAFAKMLMNALTLEQEAGIKIGDEVDYISSGTYMEINKISKRSGKVEVTQETSLYMPEGVCEGEAIIGGVKYFVDFDMRPYLGYTVECWSKEIAGNEYPQLICVLPKSYNEEITIEAENIESVSSDIGEIRYLADGKSKKLRIDGDFSLIYNGKCRLKKEASYLKPSLGSITLLDNDGDGRYDVVSVRAYEVYTVNYIYNDIIYDQNGKDPLDLSDEKTIRSIVKNGDESNLRYISKDDIVYAAVSEDGSFVEINASNKKIEGRVGEIEEIGVYRYYTIDGKKYLASAELDTENILGCSGVFHFGPTGIIEMQIVLPEGKYGILLAAAEEGGMGDKQVKIFTSDGQTRIFDLKENALLCDGIQTKIGDTEFAILQAYADLYVSPPQSADVTNVSVPVIMYTADEYGIKSISLPELYDDEKSGSSRGRYTLQSVTEKANMLYRRSYNRFLPANRSFNPSTDINFSDGKTKFVSDKTIVFEVVTEQDGRIEAGYENKIRVSNGNTGFASWEYGNFYNFDDDRIPGVMVKYERMGTVAEIHGLLIKSTARTLNSEGEECTVLSGYKDGQYVSLEVKPDAVLSTSRISQILSNVPAITAETLEKGDYVYIGTDSNGKITYISPMTLARYDKSQYIRYHNEVDGENYGEIIFGEVINVRDRALKIKLDRNLYNSEEIIFYETGWLSAAKSLYDSKEETVSGKCSVLCEGDYVLIMRSGSRILDMHVIK